MGYILLILLAILAPTPIPVPLDGIILGLIASGYKATNVLLLAIIGDVIGTSLIFVLGRGGRDVLAEYRKRKRRRDYIIAERLFLKYGKYALFFSGVPFLGDALIFLSGFYRLHVAEFVTWFLLGKVLWYTLVLVPIVVIGRPLLRIVS